VRKKDFPKSPGDVYRLPEEDLSSDPNSPPPVVILSGVSKEVPSGLVFGFDINEQLLLEDSSCQMLDNVVVRDNVSKNDSGTSIRLIGGFFRILLKLV